MWSLLGVEQAIGMQLTESMAMLPAAAVSAVVFANRCAQYFAVGKITADQVADYAARKGVPLEQVQKWLEPMLKCASADSAPHPALLPRAHASSVLVQTTCRIVLDARN